MQTSVQILLATYNGERFLREQLDSLFQQTFQDFTVLIRDDGSVDNTLQIIEEFQHMFPEKNFVLKDNYKNVGVTQNFNLLLEKSTANYIFFCDQDDIWLPDKIQKSLNAIFTLENSTDKSENSTVPCLVFSDMKAIDEQGKITNNSVWKKLFLHPDYFTLNRLLIQNIPHGCTMVINKAMRNLAFPITKDAILHDHWIALLAASCGRYIALKEPLMLLRNHSKNLTRKQNSILDKLKRFTTNYLSKDEYEYFIKIRVTQAKALLERIASCAPQKQIDLLNNFILLEKTSGIKRKKILLEHKFFRTTFWHTFKMIARA